MANYRISPNAKEDLERIYLYGFNRWGMEAADAYYAAFLIILRSWPNTHVSMRRSKINLAFDEALAEKTAYFTALTATR